MKRAGQNYLIIKPKHVTIRILSDYDTALPLLKMHTLGVISDTHIPDRAQSLDKRILPIFSQLGVDAILHAGDISSPKVLDLLAQIAPTYAVRGNRDLTTMRSLPPNLLLEFNGIPLILTHGHGRLHHYLVDKVKFAIKGYQAERYQRYLLSAYPVARVIVFGHTHHALNRWVDGCLLFNPGSAHFPDNKKEPPSIGLIRIDAGGNIDSEIIWL